MNLVLCYLDQGIYWLAQVYVVLMLIYAIVSWLPDLRGAWVRYLAMLIEPLLNPIRRIVPPVGGLDLAFLVLILVLQFLIIPLITRAEVNACYSLF